MIPLQHKAAGHEGPMQSIDGSLFVKPTTNQEIEFYNKTQVKRMKLGDIEYGESLFDWMPEYVGVLYPGASNDLIRETNGRIDQDLLNKATDTLEIEGENKQYLILNNVLNGFSQPSIMDIKLGSILYDDSASIEKIERMKNVSKTTTSGSLSFRIAGMIIKDDFEGKLPQDLPHLKMKDVCNKDFEKEYLTFNKYFGRKLTKENVSEGLKIFFRYNKLPKKVQDIIIQNFYVRLQMLYNCLLDEEVRIVSGSLFFVFENDIERWEKLGYEDPIIQPQLANDEDEDDEEEEDTDDDVVNAPLSTLKFIDFAHAKYTPTQGYDEGIVSGIENLFEIIEHV
ncbi:hypothetical protein C6P40_002864 [Pichia californica]|uniref:Kinase n=1 Tax=Pichia californica TaxID=460514 RepID=A0A9P6WHA0_9ASCO|nr:hypothetical protein C6P40_002864 [[Candida] californica]